jgi:hypothetical protein
VEECRQGKKGGRVNGSHSRMVVFYSAFVSSHPVTRRAAGCRLCAVALLCRPPVLVFNVSLEEQGSPETSLPKSTASNPNIRGRRTVNTYRPTNFRQVRYAVGKLQLTAALTATLTAALTATLTAH